MFYCYFIVEKLSDLHVSWLFDNKIKEKEKHRFLGAIFGSNCAHNPTSYTTGVH